MSTVSDWTSGSPAIAFQRCTACDHIQYFCRGFCAACGGTSLSDNATSGRGTVYSVTTVHRAATPEARAHVPYVIALIDADEGFRMMAHGEADLAIGDRVSATFHNFAGCLAPLFRRSNP